MNRVTVTPKPQESDHEPVFTVEAAEVDFHSIWNGLLRRWDMLREQSGTDADPDEVDAVSDLADYFGPEANVAEIRQTELSGKQLLGVAEALLRAERDLATSDSTTDQFLAMELAPLYQELDQALAVHGMATLSTKQG